MRPFQRRYGEAWKRFRLVWVSTQWWVPSLSSGISQGPGLLSQAPLSFDKGLEGLEASVALGSVERRPPSAGFIAVIRFELSSVRLELYCLCSWSLTGVGGCTHRRQGRQQAESSIGSSPCRPLPGMGVCSLTSQHQEERVLHLPILTHHRTCSARLTPAKICVVR